MIARFSPCSEDLQRLQVGPIGPHLPSFATLVSQQGYCSVTGWLKVRLVAKLSRWLLQHRVPLSQLNETQIVTFFNARWKRLKRHVGDQTTMALLLWHLRQANVVAPPPESGTGSDTDLLCAEYECFLLKERSLTPSSTENYLIRDDISANLLALEELHQKFRPDMLLLESGGDNLAACFSRELADFTIQVIDVAGGDKIPRKGGPGLTQSDLLVINKTDLAPTVGADLEVMARDAKKMRGAGVFVMAQVKHDVGVDEIISHIIHAWKHASGILHEH